ncbi:flagellar hook-associated protein FlgL [Thermomonas alba]|uniref:flagellar hook-associated protein FlgL n=1 Tax=Thermomonas alba TaxID=2888525 RepID=UPI001F0454C2|nr:flagellar hook-associated protein FlgL [Thermomonas alba]
MSTRISTAQIHYQSLSALQFRQAEIQKYQQQIATGVRLSRAADDPSGMTQAKQLEQALARLDQYQRNNAQLSDRLQQQEGALGDAGDVLQRARELAIQANSGALSDSDRHTIALELRSLREHLLQIANREDGHGRRLFAGTQDGVQPFVDAGGSVSYVGNDGQNYVDVADDSTVADTDPGSRVFMRIPTGDGISRTRASAANAGTGRIESAQVTDPITWNGATLQLRFTSPTSYEVVDGNGNPLTPPVSGAWTSGQAVNAQGATFVISGSPATGDTFVLEKSPSQDVFTTLKTLADALDAPVASDPDRARLANAMRAGLEDIVNAHNHLQDIRARTGVQLAGLADVADVSSASNVTLNEMLSKVRDTDLADAISRLQYNMTALEAAQRMMARLQGSSLFDKL